MLFTASSMQGLEGCNFIYISANDSVDMIDLKSSIRRSSQLLKGLCGIGDSSSILYSRLAQTDHLNRECPSLSSESVSSTSKSANSFKQLIEQIV